MVESLKMYCSWWISIRDGDSRKGGLILLQKDLICVTIQSSSSGHIDAVISHE